MWILFLILIFIVAILAWCFTNSIKDYGIKRGLILPLLYASLSLGGFAFIIWLLIKCDFNANDKINNTTTKEVVNDTPNPTPTVTKTFNVEAKIYHFIGTAYDGYEKATNKTITLGISKYSDGSVYCTSIRSDGFFPLPIRYSRTEGFDYECNNGNIIYKFNTNELD
jgi:hypothetical protein|nr:MAG TPA: chitin synthase regulator [Caudoviricetes sp.]